jgi:hypothetical protein
MIIANATGCSSIWGGSAPSTPYTTNKEGKGPAWANSLFEDNAEYGLGMATATRQRREKLADIVKEIAGSDKASDTLKAACNAWLENKDNAAASKEAGEALLAECKALCDGGCTCANVKAVVRNIVNDRMALGQFDECEITLKELNVIMHAVINNLTGIYHSRVEYPKLNLDGLDI